MAKSKPSSSVFNITAGAEEFLSATDPEPTAPSKTPSKKPARKSSKDARAARVEGLKSCTIYLDPEDHTKLKVLTAIEGKTQAEVIAEAVRARYSELGL